MGSATPQKHDIFLHKALQIIKALYPWIKAAHESESGGKFIRDYSISWIIRHLIDISFCR
jgi:hypothetical protein